MTMLTTTKPSKPTTVAISEQMLARFERDRSKLVEQRAALTQRRSAVAFDAHAEPNGPAAKLLDDLIEDDGELQARIVSADDAIAEARRRLERARAAEARQQEREKAKALRLALARFVDAGKGCDSALEVLIACSAAMRDSLTQMNRCGATHPSHAQLDALGAIALRTALTQTAWNRYFERTAPGERKTFAALVAAWSTMVERNIQQRLGSDEPEAA
jgi:hypothetical protein